MPSRRLRRTIDIQPANTSPNRLQEATAQVGTLSVEEARKLVGRADVQFVDVRDRSELERDGRIPGVVHAARGLLEFYADPSSPLAGLI